MYKKSEANDYVTQYPKEIEKNSKMFGYKTANLLFLDNLLNEIQTKLELKVVIPTFVPIPPQLIEEHLDKYPNQSNGWQQLFEEFKTAYEAQDNNKSLDANTVQKLQYLQKYILNYFIDHPLEFNKLPKELQAFKFFMVRSTGVNEDKVDMANAGGNESLPANAATISKALAQVVASYVSEKSLLQRLRAGDKHITDRPVMPVLIQTLVSEGLTASHSEAKQKVISGVIYTNSGSMRIQSAPGHGEYVVNSKGLTDNYYISKEGIIYSEIRPKYYRLVPKLNSTDNSISLSWKSNEAQEVYSSSLPPEVLQLIKCSSSNLI